MAIGGVIAIVAIAAGGAIYGSDQQRKAAHASQDANRRAERIESLKQQRDITDRIRQTRIQAASVEGAAAAQGVQGSSPFVNAQSALYSDLNANVSLAEQIGQLRAQRLNDLSKAERYGQRAQLGFQASSTALSFA